MPTFGIIGEGVTDQAVIKNILVGYFNEGAFVTAIQPAEPIAGEGPQPGGWDLVFKSLQAGRHKEALQNNDYIVIHIDTDVSEQKGYDVPWREGSGELSVEQLASRVTEKLKVLIGADFYAAHHDKFIFAIAVHAIECWLLPLHTHDNHAKKTSGCLEAVNHALISKNIRLTRGRYGAGKDPRAYREASRDFTKRGRLLQVRDRNPSLGLFVRQLDAIIPPEPATPDAV
jgi:hypothetical protein